MQSGIPWYLITIMNVELILIACVYDILTNPIVFHIHMCFVSHQQRKE